MSAFDDFVDDAAELFGMNEDEATDLLESLENLGFDIEENMLSEPFWGGEAADSFEDVVDIDALAEAWWDDSLDPEWEYGEDDWVDADDDIEITTAYSEAV